MATFQKRGKKWRAQIIRKIDGKRTCISETFPTKAHAQAWATEKESELLGIVRTGITGRIALPGQDAPTLQQALVRYRDEVSPTKRGARWEQVRINKIVRDYPEFVSVRMSQLAPEHIAKWRDQRLTEVQSPSVRREMVIIASVLEQARLEWRWIATNPIRDVRKPPHNKKRKARITDAMAAEITQALGFDGSVPAGKRQEVAIMFLLSIETGMRSGELVAQQWKKTHLARRFLTTEQTKNGDERDIPLSPRAIELLELMKGVNKLRVFTVGDAERDALFRAARPEHLRRLHYHDTRHEATVRLSKKVDVLQLARILGHRDLKSLMIYYDESAEDMAGKL